MIVNLGSVAIDPRNVVSVRHVKALISIREGFDEYVSVTDINNQEHVIRPKGGEHIGDTMIRIVQMLNSAY